MAVGLGADNLHALNPNGQPMNSPKLIAAWGSQQVQDAVKQGGTHTVNVEGTDYTVTNGRIMAMKTGGIWKPLLAAAAVAATGGLAAAYLGPAAAAAGGGTAAGTAGTLAGVEGGAAGLSDAALAGLGTGAMGGGGAAAAGAGAAGAAESGFGADGVFTGATTYGDSAATGAGGLGKYLDAAGDVSNALGGIAGGRAAGRIEQTNANASYDRATQDQYRTQVQANQNENQFGLNLADETLRQKQFQLAAPGARAHNAVRGDILSNAQDVSIGGLPSGVTVPNISGGLRPSMFTAPTKQLGTDMTAQAAAGQQAGDAYALPTYKPNPLPPGVTKPVQATGVDTGINTAGTVLSLAQLMAKYYR